MSFSFMISVRVMQFLNDTGQRVVINHQRKSGHKNLIRECRPTLLARREL